MCLDELLSWLSIVDTVRTNIVELWDDVNDNDFNFSLFLVRTVTDRVWGFVSSSRWRLTRSFATVVRRLAPTHICFSIQSRKLLLRIFCIHVCRIRGRIDCLPTLSEACINSHAAMPYQLFSWCNMSNDLQKYYYYQETLHFGLGSTNLLDWSRETLTVRDGDRREAQIYGSTHAVDTHENLLKSFSDSLRRRFSRRFSFTSCRSCDIPHCSMTKWVLRSRRF